MYLFKKEEQQYVFHDRYVREAWISMRSRRKSHNVALVVIVREVFYPFFLPV